MTFRNASASFTPYEARIAIISHTHPSISKGGAEIAAYTLFKGLISEGCDAIFIGGCPIEARAKLELGPNEHAVFFDGSTYDHFYHLAAGDTLRQLRGILTAKGVTLVSFHHYMNLGISALRDVAAELPTLLTIHEFLAICHHHGQMITRPAHILCNSASPRACGTCYPEFSRQQFAVRRQNFLEALSEVDAFVSPSRFLADRYIAWGLPRDRMHVIENGLANPHSRRAGPARDEDQSWTYGFFGQINPFKGIDLILRACPLIAKDRDFARRVKIRIHGNFIGQPAEFIESFQKALKDYAFLSYSGPYDNVNVGRLMGACDYVLVPSSWWENSPVVIQEAYDAGRPVVCTGIGGMAEKVINGVTGLHFELNDPSSFVAALKRGASPEMFGKLQAGLPGVGDAREMARNYLAVMDGLSTGDPAQRLAVR